jgi:hypothetical protein
MGHEIPGTPATRARASAKPVPSVATSVSASASASLPDHTAEPVSAPNRPSSSWKLTTETGGPPCSRAVRATSSAAMTP